MNQGHLTNLHSGLKDERDLNLGELRAISKASDWELCEAHWGRESGLCPRPATDDGEGDLKEGDAVFVLQVDWGDDSVGLVRNRLEGKVVEVGHKRRAGYVHVK